MSNTKNDIKPKKNLKTPDYMEENRRRKKAVRRADSFNRSELFKQGLESNFPEENKLTNTEKSLEK